VWSWGVAWNGGVDKGEVEAASSSGRRLVGIPRRLAPTPSFLSFSFFFLKKKRRAGGAVTCRQTILSTYIYLEPFFPMAYSSSYIDYI
jgi:hypothetical protein